MRGISILRISKSILELFSLIAMAAVFVLFALMFNHYPAGQSYSVMFFGRGFTVGKITLFVMFLMCGGINASMFIVSRFPSLYRYPFKITADNIEIQYHLAKIMLSIMQILVSVLFWILFMQIHFDTAHGGIALHLNVIFDFCILFAITAAAYIVLAYKFK